MRIKATITRITRSELYRCTSVGMHRATRRIERVAQRFFSFVRARVSPCINSQASDRVITFARKQNGCNSLVITRVTSGTNEWICPGPKALAFYQRPDCTENSIDFFFFFFPPRGNSELISSRTCDICRASAFAGIIIFARLSMLDRCFTT